MMPRRLSVNKTQGQTKDTARASPGTVSGRIGRDIVLMPH